MHGSHTAVRRHGRGHRRLLRGANGQRSWNWASHGGKTAKKIGKKFDNCWCLSHMPHEKQNGGCPSFPFFDSLIQESFEFPLCRCNFGLNKTISSFYGYKLNSTEIVIILGWNLCQRQVRRSQEFIPFGSNGSTKKRDFFSILSGLKYFDPSWKKSMRTNDFPIKTSTSRAFAICFCLDPFSYKKKRSQPLPAPPGQRSAHLRLPGHCLHDLCQMAFCTGAIVKVIDPGLLGAGAEAGRQAGSEKRRANHLEVA